LATIEFVERNGRTWTRATGDPDETDEIIRAAAASDIDEASFRDWVAARIS